MVNTGKRRGKSKGTEVQPASPEIPEGEQWRLVNESGILRQNIPRVAKDPPETDLADEIFNAVLLIIPFSFLYLMMDILIHQQYGQHPLFRDYSGRLLTAVPILSIFIFYTNRHKPKHLMQLVFFFSSLAAGIRLIWLVNRAPWHIIIRQGPPLATIWIYTITLLNLLPAVFGLCIVAVWVWISDMRLVF